MKSPEVIALLTTPTEPAWSPLPANQEAVTVTTAEDLSSLAASPPPVAEAVTSYYDEGEES